MHIHLSGSMRSWSKCTCILYRQLFIVFCVKFVNRIFDFWFFPLLIFTYWNLIFVYSVLHFMQLCSVVHNVLTFMDMAAFWTALWMHDKNNAYTAVNVCLSWCACGQNDAASKFSRNVKMAAGSFVHKQCLQQYSTPLVFMQQNHLRTATDMSSHGNAPTTFTQQHTHLHNDNKLVFT